MKLPFISITEKEKQEMLAAIGVHSTDEFFSHIPEKIRANALKAFSKPYAFSEPLSEMEIIEEIKTFASMNEKALKKISFQGAGAYRHFVPSALNYVLSRSEFLTSYTPYQPEISQGTLQATFEFQSYAAMLTGMDIANASMYDGATATAEAVSMAMKITGRNRVLLSKALHPNYVDVIKTYTNGIGANIEFIDFDRETGFTSDKNLHSMINEQTACAVIGYPNFFGIVEPIDRLFGIVKENKAIPIAVITEAMSTGMLNPPGSLGAGIVVMECQSFGVPLMFGGPYIGVIATKKEYVRQLPGRLVGETVDRDGNRAWTLTLATREQHIRREKATSNICSNEGLLAITVAMYLSLIGQTGLINTARINHKNAVYLLNKLKENNGITIPFSGPIFNEFVVSIRGMDRMYDELIRRGFIPGVSIGRFYEGMDDCLLINTTELHTQRQLDLFVEAVYVSAYSK